LDRRSRESLTEEGTLELGLEDRRKVGENRMGDRLREQLEQRPRGREGDKIEGWNTFEEF
jgi:hypothetical protein